MQYLHASIQYWASGTLGLFHFFSAFDQLEPGPNLMPYLCYVATRKPTVPMPGAGYCFATASPERTALPSGTGWTHRRYLGQRVVMEVPVGTRRIGMAIKNA